MSTLHKTGLVITAHPGDFVWRAGGAIALHVKRGMRIRILCLAYGERGESQFAWKQPGVIMADVKAQRRDEAERAAAMLGAEIEFMDAGDYPLRTTDTMLNRAIDIFHECNPSFVLTHSLEDPYNVDHPEATRFAQEARIIAQAAGHKPDPDRAYAAPPVFLFEPHQPEQCNFKPNVI
ncbi:MAG: PIG-L deacetylase family protein, partial [Beijerinckiaceae bacterium]